MAFKLRPVVEEEWEAVGRLDALAFGSDYDAEGAADALAQFDLTRTRAAFDGDQIVGASAVIGFELTVPGLALLPAAGITWVGVAPTHRRRGILRSLMAELLEDAAARGEPVAILTASEGLLYGRFGFGLASSKADAEIDRRHGRLLGPPEPGGRLAILSADEAPEVLREVHDQARRAQPGDLDRPPGWWAEWLRDPEKHRRGASPLVHAGHFTGASCDGYATYRVKPSWTDGSPDGRVVVIEVVALGAGAEADLWRYLLDIDLTQVVEVRGRPVDDPLRWMLADPRRLVVRCLRDSLWLCLLDVPAALAARRYSQPGRLVVEVTGGFWAAAAGCYGLEAGPDGAECRRTAEPPDVVLGPADLGALYLGGVAASTLAAAGRVSERRPGALARADAMFATRPAPFCRTGF